MDFDITGIDAEMRDAVDGNGDTPSARHGNTAVAQIMTILNAHNSRRAAPSRRPVDMTPLGLTTARNMPCRGVGVGHTAFDVPILIFSTDGKQALARHHQRAERLDGKGSRR